MNNRKAVFLAALLLGAMFALQVSSARGKSPTYDEQGFIARGYAFVKLSDLHIRIGTPIFLNALNALPLLSLPDVRLPVDEASWSGTDFHSVSNQFLWHVNDNADQIVFLARVPTMLLSLLMAAFVYRWSKELFGLWGGLLSLLLCTFDPNILAHGRLATTDLGTSALLFIATFWAWRLLRHPRWRHVLSTGLFFGLAQAAKFSALLFGPIFVLLFLWRSFVPLPFALPYLPFGLSNLCQGKPRWWKRAIGLLVAGVFVVAVASLTLWATYGFQVGPIPGLTSWPVPAPSHLEQLLDISGRLSGEEGRQSQAFLVGQLYVGGRWDYFPIAFLLKTPIPTLTFFAGALVVSLRTLVASRGRRRVGAAAYALWLPPLIYFASSLTSELNLGYRYILPVLPFVLVACGQVGRWLQEGFDVLGRSRRALSATAAGALACWSVWSGLTIYPHYLAFFNELAGGPENGWRFLVDSNIDWGQDLKGLKRWMEVHGVERVKLGYAGEAYPSYYGIDFDPLPSYPDRWRHPAYHDLYPWNPAPGYYAISVNLIQGRNLPNPDTYAWFREREPLDKVGYSIFIYRVPVRGQGRAVIGLSGLALADIRPEDYATLGTNDVRVVWFDVSGALMLPGGDETYRLFVAGDATPHPALTRFWQWESEGQIVTRDGHPLLLYEGNPRSTFEDYVRSLTSDAPVWHLPAAQFAPGDPANHGQPLACPVSFGDQIELLAYEVNPASGETTDLRPGETLTVVTYWRVRSSQPGPLKLFVHLLDAQSTYRGGQDRLDVWHDNWRPGDLFAQVQQVTLDPDAPAGEYQVEIGWYHPQTMQRLPVLQGQSVIADRVLLKPIQVR